MDEESGFRLVKYSASSGGKIISLRKGDEEFAYVRYFRAGLRSCLIDFMFSDRSKLPNAQFREEYSISPAKYLLEELVRKGFRTFSYSFCGWPGVALSNSLDRSGLTEFCPGKDGFSGHKASKKFIYQAFSREKKVPREPSALARHAGKLVPPKVRDFVKRLRK